MRYCCSFPVTRDLVGDDAQAHRHVELWPEVFGLADADTIRTQSLQT
jgi:hypothetical protein